jgi:hypothetical protein
LRALAAPLRSFLPPAPAALPAALLQSVQYALAKGAVLRPAWYITRLGGGGGARGRSGEDSAG